MPVLSGPSCLPLLGECLRIRPFSPPAVGGMPLHAGRAERETSVFRPCLGSVGRQTSGFPPFVPFRWRQTSGLEALFARPRASSPGFRAVRGGQWAKKPRWFMRFSAFQGPFQAFPALCGPTGTGQRDTTRVPPVPLGRWRVFSRQHAPQRETAHIVPADSLRNGAFSTLPLA
jgi:hypothetical protein